MNQEIAYEYEMFFDSKEDEPVKIHGWYPIATDRIRNPEKIERNSKEALKEIAKQAGQKAIEITNSRLEALS